MTLAMARHPLAPLAPREFAQARAALTALHGPAAALAFRSVLLDEPPKAELVPFLEAEHAGRLGAHTPRPPRRARAEYDVVAAETRAYTVSVVDLDAGAVVSTRSAPGSGYPSFTADEFAQCQDIVVASALFRDAMSEFPLPEGFAVTVDPWPYGGPDATDDHRQYMQALVFAKPVSAANADANHYAYPIPLIVVIDWAARSVVRVDRLATGGAHDAVASPLPAPAPRFQHARPAEYVPELLDGPLRTGLRPLNVVQPDGPSFAVDADGLVQWQRWRFRIGFTPREGVVVHDLCYQNRPVVYRLSFSELTVPYADPRPPFHRKQAFDFGDVGVGRAANNLQLGCDCLGAIHYLDAYLVAPDGSPSLARSVICLHEQDDGILWKHTNYRTGRAVAVRSRELVVQFVCTLANYEYVFAYKLDLAGAITLETRATGVASVVSIEAGKRSDYGNVVTPGVLAQNHQHIFVARIDPAIDSYAEADTQVVVEESHGAEPDPETNPHGNLYRVRRKTVDTATWIDAEPRLNRLLKLENAHKCNAVSGNRVGYRLVAPATPTMLAHEDSLMARRAPYTRHNFWITGFRDGEFWAAGEFTNQSRGEMGGVADMVKRGDWFIGASQGHDGVGPNTGRRSSPVVWTVYGLTHNPRVEDWPVMPVETFRIHLRPADFFTRNPALDVPSAPNRASVVVPCCAVEDTVQQDPTSHLQGADKCVDARDAGAGGASS